MSNSSKKRKDFSPRQKKDDNARKNAARKQDEVIQKYGRNCYICGSELISIKELKINNLQILSNNCYAVVYLDNEGNVKLGKVLTIDHVCQLRENPEFPNAIENLRPACFQCNNDRNKRKNDGSD